MNKTIASKFVEWDVPELDALKDSKAYRLRKLLNEKGRLSRNDKIWLTKNVNENSYFKTAVPVQGWFFDFKDVLHLYWVKRDDYITEHYATDMFSLRCTLYGTIKRIVRIK